MRSSTHGLALAGVLLFPALPAGAFTLSATPMQEEPQQEDAPPEAKEADEGAEEESGFFDPEDGWFDVSKFLEHPAGFLPIGIPITEPAVGYGLVLGAAFLDPREEAGKEGWNRPNITAVAAMRTENGSDGFFGGDSRLWCDGDRQTLIGGGSFGLELALYGIGRNPELDNDPRDYTFDAAGGIAEVRERLGETDAWLGLRYTYADAEVDFEGSSTGIPGVHPERDDVTLSGPSVTFRYDTFDNLFTPTRGMLSDTSATFFDDVFGGSEDFQLFQQVLINYWGLREDLFLGVRGQFNASFGDVPFYARPFIQLRGVPAQRYQGEQAGSVELELRWQVHRRIGLVGFGGAGVAWNDSERFENDQDAWAGGVGVRYLLSRKFGLHAGVDVAHGPEEGAIYFQVGNAWLRP